jgi:valyl-tRNA synthetase
VAYGHVPTVPILSVAEDASDGTIGTRRHLPMLIIDREDGTYEVQPYEGYEEYDGRHRVIVQVVTDALCRPECSEDARGPTSVSSKSW